jgi:predicted N-acyltransferase
MTVEIQLAQIDDAKEWDRIISESPHGTLFHKWDWLKITEKHTQTKLYPIIGIKNGVSIGIFPLFFQKKGPARMVFSPPPHAALFYLGPVFVGCEVLRQEKWENLYVSFHNAVENFIIKKLRANYISISLSPALQDPRPFIWSGYKIEPNYDYAVNLSKGIDDLYTSLDRKQRADIKRAEGKGMIVEIGTKKEYEEILNLMDIRYTQQSKVVTESKEYFWDLYDICEENLKIFVVKINGKVVTGTIDLQYRDTLYCWIGNPKPRTLISPSPNDLLFCECVRYASENGLKYHTTFGAAGNERLHSYYAAKFNPELIIRFHAKKTSLLSRISEKGYTTILKPLRGKIRNVIYDV